MTITPGDPSTPPSFTTAGGNLDSQKEQDEADTKHRFAPVGRAAVLGIPHVDALPSAGGPDVALIDQEKDAKRWLGIDMPWGLWRRLWGPTILLPWTS